MHSFLLCAGLSCLVAPCQSKLESSAFPRPSHLTRDCTSAGKVWRTRSEKHDTRPKTQLGIEWRRGRAPPLTGASKRHGSTCFCAAKSEGQNSCAADLPLTNWPNRLRRWLQAPVRKAWVGTPQLTRAITLPAAVAFVRAMGMSSRSPLFSSASDRRRMDGIASRTRGLEPRPTQQLTCGPSPAAPSA